VRLTLLSRQDCHLCLEAESDLRSLGAAFETVDVDGDAALAARYGGFIPVLLAGDREIARAPMTKESLRWALERLSLEGQRSTSP
jgi:glutaredoxin